MNMPRALVFSFTLFSFASICCLPLLYYSVSLAYCSLLFPFYSLLRALLSLPLGFKRVLFQKHTENRLNKAKMGQHSCQLALHLFRLALFSFILLLLLSLISCFLLSSSSMLLCSILLLLLPPIFLHIASFSVPSFSLALFACTFLYTSPASHFIFLLITITVTILLLSQGLAL